jgi:hypothetical protein
MAENGTKDMLVVDWGQAVCPRSLEQKQIEGDLREQYGLGTRLLFCVDAHAAARVTHRGIIGMVENEKSIGRVLTSRSVTHRQQR